MQTKNSNDRQFLFFTANLDQISYKKGGFYYENQKAFKKTAIKQKDCGKSKQL